MKRLNFFCILLGLLVNSCRPDNITDKIKDTIDEGINMVADKMGDQYFKTGIALIELHKVRNGSYPESLNDLEYLGAQDSATIYHLKYMKLESGYSLNLRLKSYSVDSRSKTKIILDYPKEFWKGLGIAESDYKPSSASAIKEEEE